MTEIVRGDGMKYALAYNGFHNLESIGVAGMTNPLIRYTYKNVNGRLKQVTYANGDHMQATYNSAGQMVAEKWFDSNNIETAHYKYVYDSDGNIVRSIDILAKKEYTYVYEDGNIVRATESDITLSGEIVTAKTLVNAIQYVYDSEGKLTEKVIAPANGAQQTIRYKNPDEGNAVVTFEAGGRTVTSHSKNDSFGRKEFDELQLGTDFVSRQFVYHAGEVTDEHKDNAKVKSSATTQLVSQIILSDGRTISYEYDAEERITKVIDSVEGTTEYTYDALGQLLTETVNGAVVNSMEYDGYGNIIKKNDAVYTYGDGTWKDLLTSYNDQAIEYDEQGNPTSYLGHTLTWEKGRQLKSFDGNTYTYNANGIRTSKTVHGVTHNYTLDGTKILREVWGDNSLIPLYDNEDSVCGIIYNEEPYYFIKNLQGDVIAIVDKDAQTVARYSYDAWGVPTVTQDSASIATINPFRYRGYYYDEEIGLYYIQSRYYNPQNCRFINADDATMFMFSKTIDRTNLFVYCKNDPVGDEDSSGYAVGDYIHAIGIQIAANIGGIPIGIEFLWSTKTWKPVVFLFAGISGSANPSKGYNLIDDLIYPMFKNVSKSASAVMKAISKSNLSISFIGVFGSKKQAFPAGYCGTFTGFSASIKIFWINIAFSAAIGKNSNGIIGSVGLGVSLTNGFSISKTYYVQLTGKNAKTNNLTTLFDTIRSKIKAATDKFKKIARFIA